MQCNKNNVEFTRVLELLGSGATFLESSPGNFDNSSSHQHYPPPSAGIIVIITFTILSSWFLPLASHLDINHIICNIFWQNIFSNHFWKYKMKVQSRKSTSAVIYLDWPLKHTCKKENALKKVSSHSRKQVVLLNMQNVIALMWNEKYEMWNLWCRVKNLK